MQERPYLQLAHLPTPLHPLPHLSQVFGGPEIWVKRDDQTGLAFGGNKTRKLERLVGLAKAEGSQRLLTRGAPQSNHCRQTAAAAASCGMACTLVLQGEQPTNLTANLLLDHLLGAEVVWSADNDPQETLEQVHATKIASGEIATLIPYGGSSPLGASAYADAIDELMSQSKPFDRIIFATSSGGTQAGLLAGILKNNLMTTLDGISVDQPKHKLIPLITKLAIEVLDMLGIDAFIDQNAVEVDDRYLGEGYAIMGELEHEAIQLFAQHEGLLLDPVYTGRAAGGMLAKIRTGEIAREERVLFWHTGGTPALFAFAQHLLSE